MDEELVRNEFAWDSQTALTDITFYGDWGVVANRQK